MTLIRLTAVVASAACAAALAAGCGSDDDEADTPTACVAGSEDYVRVLSAAPEPVAFDDGTTISECLPPEQTGGQLAEVGEEMIAAATTLNARARRDPDGPAAADLGYLVGAVEEGADSIHADLVRRLNASARFSDDGKLLPVAFERTFGEGYAAGLQSG